MEIMKKHMADPNNLSHIHVDRAALTLSGAALYLLGVNGLFMSYDTQKPPSFWKRSKPLSQTILQAAIVSCIGGLLLILLSTILYEHEKESQATSIAGMIQQQRQKSEENSKTHESAIMQGISMAVILCGLSLLLWDYHQRRDFRWTSMLVYLAGWTSVGITLGTGSKSLSNLEWERLLFTVPGALAVAAGTIMIPWELKQSWMMGPSLSIMAIGLGSLSIGHILVREP